MTPSKRYFATVRCFKTYPVRSRVVCSQFYRKLELPQPDKRCASCRIYIAENKSSMLKMWEVYCHETKEKRSLPELLISLFHSCYPILFFLTYVAFTEIFESMHISHRRPGALIEATFLKRYPPALSTLSSR